MVKRINIDKIDSEFRRSIREEHPGLMAQYDRGIMTICDVLHQLGYELIGVVADYYGGHSLCTIGRKVRIKNEIFPWFQKQYSDYGYELPRDAIGTIVYTDVGMAGIEWDNHPYSDPGIARKVMFYNDDLEFVQRGADVLRYAREITVTPNKSKTKYKIQVVELEDNSVCLMADKIVKMEIYANWKTALFQNADEARKAIAAYLI